MFVVFQIVIQVSIYLALTIHPKINGILTLNLYFPSHRSGPDMRFARS